MIQLLIAGLVGVSASTALVFGGVQMTQPSGGHPKPAGDSIVTYADN